MTKFEKHILIVAGGDGKRLSNSVPKQFLLLRGRPILFHAINSFLFLKEVTFTVVLSANQIDYWKSICSSKDFNIPHNIAEGGPTRFHSVKSGLKNIPDDSLVLIHDASRPFVSKETIMRVIEMATQKGNAIPVIEVNDSYREVSGNNNKIVARDKLRAVQTPQTFHSSIIKNAYNQAYNEIFTDDASVLESTGKQINIVKGNSENIKISTPVDLVVGEGILDYTNRFKEEVD